MKSKFKKDVSFNSSTMKYCQVICSPHIYYSEHCQRLIESSTRRATNQWIYNIESSAQEDIVIRHKHFLICKDICKKEQDGKLLIVFKDSSLRTIRDLEERHINMLMEAYAITKLWMKENGIGDSWSIYFNYFPSNYQLHAHVLPTTNKTHMRAHKLLRVVQNLTKDSAYYKKALILTRLSRTNSVFPPYAAHCLDRHSEQYKNEKL